MDRKNKVWLIVLIVLLILARHTLEKALKKKGGKV